MSSERPPVLPIPQPQGSSSSSSSSPRVGSLGSSSILNSVPSSSFTNGNPSNGLKTPSPSQTPSGLGPVPHGLPVQSPQQSPYSNSQQSNQGYTYGHDSYNTMNQSMGQSQPYMDFHQSHISGGQPQAPQTVTSGGLSHYPAQPPLLQPGPGTYSPAQGSFGQYGYANGASSPQSAGHPASAPMMGAGVQAQLLPLPGQQGLIPNSGALTHIVSSSAMAPNPQAASGPGGVPGGQGFANPSFDTTGQIAPPGMKPRVTATLWEDEGSLCFQVEAKGVCVARREDNHMINGTKLLNVAGMTRGRRDGILKSEKMRHVVKIGPMHLKGVWIPFERALDFANKEKITELLYPLFVHNIGALLYHPTNQHRTNAVLHAAQERRRQESQQHQMRTSQPSQPPSLHHHHSMHNAHLPAHSIAPHPQSGRPVPDRANTFPTPPTSASSIMGMGSQDGSFQWTGQGMVPGGVTQGNPPLAIDTGLSNARSIPTTPATTPPGSSIQNMQQYQGGQSYDNNPRSMYSAPPPPQTQYVPQQQNIAQQNMARFGQPLQSNHYIKNEMGPPSARGPGSGADSEHQNDTKADLITHSQGNEQVGHGTGEEEAEHETEHDAEYTHDNNAAYANRGSYNYAAGPGVGSLQGEHPHLSPEMTGSPNNQAGSGRATPRTTAASQQQWVQNPGFNTPPRTTPATSALHQQPPRSLYNVVGSNDQRVEASNGTSGGEGYSSQPGLGMAMQTGYTPQQPTMNGSATKRMREVDEDDDHGSRPSSRGAGGDAGVDGMKRRKTIREGSAPDAGGAMGSSSFDRDAVGRLNRTRPAISQRRR
ncbi:hypothetical protein FGG08_004915 [Glutinoglossum americanum]|uniref:HTH APSES-type domain-containing protein n=1 Tax=Glutinoglossum americanum TaxID=1670608 RepID=A0A9P8HZF4_9PEZI|nr:hypothetical protein FGG08_004915 [Glutinoglossum americanum]